MELLKEAVSIIAPGLVPVGFVLLLALRLQSTKTKELEKELKETNVRILELAAAMNKYCGAPIEVVLDQLKEQREFLTSVSDDDLLNQILDKYIKR